MKIKIEIEVKPLRNLKITKEEVFNTIKNYLEEETGVVEYGSFDDTYGLLEIVKVRSA